MTLRAGDAVTFGFEFHRPWHERLYRWVRRLIGLSNKPQVFHVTSVSPNIVSLRVDP